MTLLWYWTAVASKASAAVSDAAPSKKEAGKAAKAAKDAVPTASKQEVRHSPI